MNKITIGRNAQSNIVVDAVYNTVSGNHATISYDGYTYILQDHSTNGTYVNGRLVHHTNCQINKNDNITLGTQYVLNMNKVVALLGGEQATQHRNVNPATARAVSPQSPQQPINQQININFGDAPAKHYAVEKPNIEERQNSLPQSMPNSHLGLAIVSLILGASTLICLIFSIIAVVNASKVSSLWANKQYADAQNASDKAKSFSWISIILGIILVFVWVIIFMESEM